MSDQTNESGAMPVAPSPLARGFGWGMLAILAAFLVSNVLNVGWKLPNIQDVFAGTAQGGAWVPLSLYALAIVIAVVFVQRTPQRSLRADAMSIHAFNCYVVRACFWGVFLVGLADATVALMRVENLFDGLVSEQTVKDMGRSAFVAPLIHFPLLALGALIALRLRGIGFHWLALLIVVAELGIVISRFVFSYEQALMGDLVRYWYAALFLFASAYTLFEDGHVRVDVFYAGFGATRKGYINAFGTIAFGLTTAWVIIWMGFNGKQSIINSPVMNLEVTQQGPTGMYIKYQMAAFLGIFAITMVIQFVSYFLESVANWRGEPGQREIAPVSH